MEENQTLQERLSKLARASDQNAGFAEGKVLSLEQQVTTLKQRKKELKIRLSSTINLNDTLQEKYAAKIFDFTGLEA